MDAIKLFRGSEYYSKFIDYFCDIKGDIGHSLEDGKISTAIYYHKFIIHYAQWKMRISCGRKVRHGSSDILQDLIWFYLKISLGKDYIILMEEQKGKLRPDIIIYYKNQNNCRFIIEVKTNMGYNRKATEPNSEELKERIGNIAKVFKIKQDNVIYILESPGNVSKEFESRYWDKKNKSPKEPPSEFPYSQMFPLFYSGPDPFYWEYEKGFNRNKEVKQITYSQVIKKANENIINDFNKILSKIKNG